ncbi:MAG: transcriptional repressor [Candidatus Limnocylindrales bacterium]
METARREARDDAAELLSSVARAGYRVTHPRKAVAYLIAGRRGHFTAADLIAEASHQKMRLGRATVFRNLDLLTELDVLERLDLPSGDHAYVRCAPEQHHHHVVCRACGRSVEIDDAGLQPVVRQVELLSGYEIDSHRLELFGLCPEHRVARGGQT